MVYLSVFLLYDKAAYGAAKAFPQISALLCIACGEPMDSTLDFAVGNFVVACDIALCINGERKDFLIDDIAIGGESFLEGVLTCGQIESGDSAVFLGDDAFQHLAVCAELIMAIGKGAAGHPCVVYLIGDYLTHKLSEVICTVAVYKTLFYAVSVFVIIILAVS